ncbi:MAG: V-type ATPase 116kDa subunit family protein [Actinomycetes bacterium]
MPWRDALEPVRMDRVALVGPAARLRDLLVHVADSGTVELDEVTGPGEALPGDAARRLQRLGAPAVTSPCLCPVPTDLDALERDGRVDLLEGEAQLDDHLAAAVRRGEVAALAGWAPSSAVPQLAEDLGRVGCSAVRLPRPRGVDPPTLLPHQTGVGRSLSPLVQTYATVPYPDVDPTLLASLAYVLMFGMMFGDVGQGALLVLGALYLASPRSARRPLLQRVRRAWPFVLGAGVAATVFGLLYGEFFGPTGVIPALWLNPLDDPVQLLAAAIGVGAVLLAGAYALGTVNRFREGGWPLALYAPSGIAGSALFLGLGALSLGVYAGWDGLAAIGVVVWLGGLTLAFIGLWSGAGGGAAGAAEATVELFDTVVRLGSNLVSFARLAAFGLTHAAIGAMVWAGTTALWSRGVAGALAGVFLFLAGTALAFSLEALVAAVQALRLEYYELFSRVFLTEGRPFRPWHVPTATGSLLPAAPSPEEVT